MLLHDKVSANVGNAIVRHCRHKYFALRGHGRSGLENTKRCYSNYLDLSYNLHEAKEKGTRFVVLLHGLLSSKRNFDHIGRQLAENNWNALTFDIRNHGESPHDPVMTYDAMVTDVVHAMQSHCREAVVVGHSMGGKVAMSLALKHPDMVTKLVVEDVTPEHASPKHRHLLQSYLEAVDRFEIDKYTTVSLARQAARTQLAKDITDRVLLDFMLTNITKKDGRVSWKCNIPALVRNVDAFTSFIDVGFRVYTGPTLVVRGSLSDYVSDQSLPIMRSLFPSCSMTSVPATGHWVHSERPREFLQILLEFLDK